MTPEQYETFQAELLARGYTFYGYAKTIKSESWYFAKGFAYKGKGCYRHPSYQVLFLVYDFRNEPSLQGFETKRIGVSPLIITHNDDFGRIDIELTHDNPNIEISERYAEKFYKMIKNIKK